MPGKHYRTVCDLAASQQGYFAAAQAVAAGVPIAHLPDMWRRGVVERLSRGVYRLTAYPRTVTGQYVEASLWPVGAHRSAPGVLSHDSALAFHALSDVSPTKIHISIPRRLRIRRAVPRYLCVHRVDIDPSEIEWHDGLPVTAVVRTIRDGRAAHIGSVLIRQAIDEARRRGLLTARQAGALAADLLRYAPRVSRKWCHGVPDDDGRVRMGRGTIGRWER